MIVDLLWPNVTRTLRASLSADNFAYLREHHDDEYATFRATFPNQLPATITER